MEKKILSYGKKTGCHTSLLLRYSHSTTQKSAVVTVIMIIHEALLISVLTGRNGRRKIQS